MVPKGCSKVPRPSKLQTTEKTPVTKEMRKSVRLAHLAYKARLDQEKEKKKELEETKRPLERGRRRTAEREGEVVEVKGFFGKGREESTRRFRSCR